MAYEREGLPDGFQPRPVQDLLSDIDTVLEQDALSPTQLAALPHYVRKAAFATTDEWHRDAGRYDQLHDTTDADFAALAQQRAHEQVAAEAEAQQGTAIPRTLRGVGPTALSGALLPRPTK